MIIKVIVLMFTLLVIFINGLIQPPENCAFCQGNFLTLCKNKCKTTNMCSCYTCPNNVYTCTCTGGARLMC